MNFRLTRRDPRQTVFHQFNRRRLTALELAGRIGAGEQIETTRSSVSQRSCIASQTHLPSYRNSYPCILIVYSSEWVGNDATDRPAGSHSCRQFRRSAEKATGVGVLPAAVQFGRTQFLDEATIVHD